MFEANWAEIKSLSESELTRTRNRLETIRKQHPNDVVTILVEWDFREEYLEFAEVCHIPREKAFDGTQYHYRFRDASRLSKALNTLLFLPEYITNS